MTGELVADECVQDAIVRALRADGFDVWYAQFAGMFAVIDERQVRIVALPTPQP